MNSRELEHRVSSVFNDINLKIDNEIIELDSDDYQESYIIRMEYVYEEVKDFITQTNDTELAEALILDYVKQYSMGNQSWAFDIAGAYKENPALDQSRYRDLITNIINELEDYDLYQRLCNEHDSLLANLNEHNEQSMQDIIEELGESSALTRTVYYENQINYLRDFWADRLNQLRAACPEAEKKIKKVDQLFRGHLLKNTLLVGHALAVLDELKPILSPSTYETYSEEWKTCLLITFYQKRK